MDNFKDTIINFYSCGKFVFENLTREEKLCVIGSYMNDYVPEWDSIEAINESDFSEDLATSIVKFLQNRTTEEEVIENIKNSYLSYYQDMVSDKFDEVCIDLCNDRYANEYEIKGGVL